MGRKADEMKELMGHLGGPSDEVSEVETEVEAREELPLEVKVEIPFNDNGLLTRIREKAIQRQKTVVKRIYFK